MVTSSNGNIFHVAGLLWGESIGHRWIPLTKANDAELWYFLWSMPEQTAEQMIETPVIWDAITLIMTSLWTLLNTYGVSVYIADVTMDWSATLPLTSRALMEGINMEKSSQGCYKAMQLSQ